MNIETVNLSQLVPSQFNPRKKFDAGSIAGLASSIKTDALLQNLVVSPLSGKRYQIISGERRYRALKLLEKRGELPNDFAVPVEVRKKLSDDDRLRLACVENLQRANLAPLEETAALTKMIHKGTTLETVSAQTGLSSTTIRRRLALNSLCRAAKKALRQGGISLAQAEALTLGSREAQERILGRVERGQGVSAEEIKEILLDDRPTVALAIFPLEQYTGTITTDLFAEKGASYFDDAEQFFALQRIAVEKLAEAHRNIAAWVEVTDSYHIPDWQYRPAKKNEPSGVLINFSPSGEVEVREGLARREIDQKTADETADNPIAPRHKATYGTPLRRYIAHQKSIAVQEVLLSSPRKAREVAAIQALLQLKPHACIDALSRETEPQTTYNVLEAAAHVSAANLGITLKKKTSIWEQLPSHVLKDVDLYEAIKKLSDHQLEELHTVLAALQFGQEDCDRLDAEDSLFNRVAEDLAVDMKNHWKPERSFFERRNSQQLVAIAKECGCAEVYGIGMIQSFKKSELVVSLLRHFETSREAQRPNAAQAKALNWLPEVMSFPAIDPDVDRNNAKD